MVQIWDTGINLDQPGLDRTHVFNKTADENCAASLIEAAFIDERELQCAYYTPGCIFTTVALPDEITTRMTFESIWQEMSAVVDRPKSSSKQYSKWGKSCDDRPESERR